MIYPSVYSSVMAIVFVVAYLPTVYFIYLWTDIPYSGKWEHRETTLLVSILVATFVSLGIYHYASRLRVSTVTTDIRYAIAAFVCLLIGVSLHKADLHKMWCLPYSYLQGHAAWHILTAASLHLIFIHFRSEHFPRSKQY